MQKLGEKDRDKKDSEREHSPLKPADDSIIVDTSNLDPIGVIKEIKKPRSHNNLQFKGNTKKKNSMKKKTSDLE